MPETKERGPRLPNKQSEGLAKFAETLLSMVFLWFASENAVQDPTPLLRAMRLGAFLAGGLITFGVSRRK